MLKCHCENRISNNSAELLQKRSSVFELSFQAFNWKSNLKLKSVGVFFTCMIISALNYAKRIQYNKFCMHVICTIHSRNSWSGGGENRSTYFPLSKFNDNASVIQNNLFRNRLKTLHFSLILHVLNTHFHHQFRVIFIYIWQNLTNFCFLSFSREHFKSINSQVNGICLAYRD